MEQKNKKNKVTTCLSPGHLPKGDKLQATSSGFTLLLSLIISGAVLSIGLSIFTVIIQEIKLSALGRESQIAFYAADAGVECALYWDYKERAFSHYDDDTPIGENDEFVIECGGGDSVEKVLSIPDSGFSVNTFQIDLANGSCVEVTVDKNLDDGGTTKLTANGYNLGCDSDSFLKVERSLEVGYFLGP